MNKISFLKNLEYGGFIDYDKFTIIAKNYNHLKDNDFSYYVLISDNSDLINTCLCEPEADTLLIPVVAVLKDDTPYAMIRKSILHGATAMVFKQNKRAVKKFKKKSF